MNNKIQTCSVSTKWDLCLSCNSKTNGSNGSASCGPLNAIYIYIYPGCLKYTIHISKSHCRKCITIIKGTKVRNFYFINFFFFYIMSLILEIIGFTTHTHI